MSEREREREREMGVLSNKIDRKELKPGDHIYSWRKAYIYAHHGIYVSDNQVIHFTREDGQEMGSGTVFDNLFQSSAPNPSQISCSTCHYQKGHTRGVISSCLDCFLSGGDLFRFEYSVSPAYLLANVRGGTCTLTASDPPEKVIHRATHLLRNGFGRYDLFSKNCEDFAIYCKTSLVAADGNSGQAYSVAMAPYTLLPLLLPVVRRNPVIKVASVVGTYCVTRYVGDPRVRPDELKVPVEDLTRT